MGWTKEEKDGYILVKQENGAELGYSSQSGARLIEQDGFLFKDLTGGGQLLPYLDWRLSYEERAAAVPSLCGRALLVLQQPFRPNLCAGLHTLPPRSIGLWVLPQRSRRRWISARSQGGTGATAHLVKTRTLRPQWQKPIAAASRVATHHAPPIGAAIALMQWLSIGRAADRANREEMRIMGRENMLSTRATASICIKFHLRRGPLS